MVVDKNSVVSVSYHLTVSTNNFETEETVEETAEGNPFTFLYGSGGLLEEFEGNLKGLSVGSTFDFKITAANGYGFSNKENVVRIPLQAFVAPGEELDSEMVAPGNFLPMVDDQGNHMQGLVLEVGAEFVTMDFNHPLADKDLRFQGAVLEIRGATADEIAHGHLHGPGGHEH